jgi:hypothetical protein
MKMDFNKEITRGKFFGIMGIGTLVALLIPSIFFKRTKTAIKNSQKKKIFNSKIRSGKVSIHPSAVKRINKVS